MHQTNNFLVKTTAQNIKSQSIKILIVDDQKIVRTRVQEILADSDDLTIVGMVDDGDQAISLIKSLKPDIILMDIEMPKRNGIEITKIISQRFPELKILILSTHKEETYFQQSLTAGASGYVLKQTSATHLIAAIHMVYRGYSHFGIETLRQSRLNLSKAKSTTDSINLKKKFPPQQSDLGGIGQIVDRPNFFPSQPREDKSKIVIKANDNTEISLPTLKAEEFLPSISKKLIWGSLTIVTAIALAIPATSLLKYKTTVKAQATIRPTGETRLVQATAEGEIIEILAKPGQAVALGDIIAKVDLSRLQTRKNQLTKAIVQQKLQLAQLDSQIRIIVSQITAEAGRNSSEISAAQAELAGNQRNYDEKNVEVNTLVREAQAQVSASKARFKAAKSKQMRYQSVADKGALSQEQLAEAQLEVEQQQQELAAGQAQLKRALSALNPDSSEVEMAQQRIYQVQKSGQANIASLNREQEALRQQRIGVDQQLEQDVEELSQVNIDLNNTNITATAVGTISKLLLRNPGQTVQSGQEIAQIVPSNTALEIKAMISPQDIGKLQLEQNVQMRISACPYPDYGTLDGKVSQIPLDTNKPQNDSSRTNFQAEQSVSAFYEVTVAPNQNKFGRGQDICSLQFGMEGTADIITREETVMQFIFRKARLASNL